MLKKNNQKINQALNKTLVMFFLTFFWTNVCFTSFWANFREGQVVLHEGLRERNPPAKIKIQVF